VCCRCVAVIMAVKKRRHSTCLSVWQMFRNVLQGVAGVLQCVVVCCSVLLCVAVCFGVLQ